MRGYLRRVVREAFGRGRTVEREYPAAELEVGTDGPRVRVTLRAPDGSLAYFSLTPEVAWLLGNRIVDTARESGAEKEKQVPNDTKVRQVIAERYERSLADWLARAKLWAPEHVPASSTLAVLRIDAPHDAGTVREARPINPDVQRALHVQVARHLGESEYIAALLLPEDQNVLAQTGALCVTREGYRITVL